MVRRGARVRRSAAEWAIRGLLTSLAVALGCISLAQTLATVLKTRRPADAYALSPGDGRIAASLAETLLGGDATDRARAARLARTALLRDPTVVPAVVTLGLAAQLAGDMPRARRLFAYSQQLSRRDLKSRVWGIEDAVARGDIPAALRQYDLALRTSRSAQDLLFPILSAASAEPAVAAGLAPILAARPPWGSNFIDHVAGSGPDPRMAGRLFQALRRAGVPISGQAQAVIVTRLLTHDAIDEAWNFYTLSHHETDRRRSRDPHFVSAPAYPTPFDWMPADDAGITASIQRGDEGGVLDFGVPSGIGGNVVEQVQLLPPGRYRLEGHSLGIDQPEGSRPYWTLRCRDGEELGRIMVPNSTQAGGRFSGHVSVPQHCSVQRLILVATASDAMSGATGQIDQVQLRPEGDR